MATAFFFAGAFLATAFFFAGAFLAGAFLATAFFLAGAFLATAFFFAGAFFFSAAIDLSDRPFSPAPGPFQPGSGTASLLWCPIPGKCGRASYREAETTGWMRYQTSCPGSPAPAGSHPPAGLV